MKDLKTYFFIAGVAHEGKDKPWMKTFDVMLTIMNLKADINELEEEVKFQRRINGEITKENQDFKKGIKP